jgi:hypothetical protein
MGREGTSNGASWSGIVLTAHSSNTVSVTMEGVTPDAAADSQLPPGLSKRCLPKHLAVRAHTHYSAPGADSPPPRQRRLPLPAQSRPSQPSADMSCALGCAACR